MRSLARLIIAAALSASAVIASAATTTLNVHIKDQSGAALQNVNVAAIEFGMNGPSTFTLLGVTNASGDAVFTIDQQRSYNLLYSLQGYSPTISDQFNNPEYDPNKYVWAMNSNPVYSTFTMTSGLTGVGRLEQEFSSATANTVLFGGVYNMLSQMPGGSGIVFTSNSGTGTLVVENVPFAEANTYNIGLYDPYQNKGIGRNVMTVLDSSNTVVSYTGAAKLNFNQAMPPARVDNNTGGGSASGASVEGILVSTNSEPIPYMGIGVKACLGYEWNTWANADESGRFKLYGLTPGVTYYLNVMGGCTWSQSGPGNCYEPYSSAQYSAQDICTADNSTVTPNDIVYISSDVLYHPVSLNQMPPSIGQIKVCVKSSAGYPIPNSNVNLNPDGSPWSRVNCVSHNWGTPPDDIYSPGFSNANMNTGADGCVTFDSLPGGNYMVNAWTPFSSGMTAPYNAGPDGTFTNSGMNNPGGNWQQAHCEGTGVDDYRVTVDTTQAQTMYVYDSSGTVVRDLANVALSSITYIVSTGNNTSGEVKGRISFPRVVDLTNNPVVITMFPQCNGGMGNQCPTGNMALINGSGADHYDYTVNVSSGYAYYMNVGSSNWGRVRRGGGNDTIHLEGSTSVVVNMEFQPAGTVTGTVYKPDGTVLTPSNSLWVGVNVGSDNGWSYTQLQKDGTFSMNNILPGVNRVSINVSGGGPNGVTNFNYALPSPQPTVTVVAGNTSTINLNLVKANYVGVDLDTTTVPDPTIIGNGYNTVLGFKVVPVPAGTVFKGNTISSMLFAKGEDNSQFRYSNPTGPSDQGPCGNNWPGGFCAASLPSPTVYDFYLMRSGDFGDMSSTMPVVSPPYPHFTLLTSSKNVVVDDAHANALVRPAFTMGQSSGVVVNLTPPTNMSGRGNAVFAGSVTANNFFRQADYDALGGDFDKFLEYLPVVALYDSNGAFSAAGVVVPPPSFIAQHDQDFNLAFAQGYEAFKNLFNDPGASPFGFEIRGLAPTTPQKQSCYTAVVTTPNYPPYQTRVCLGGNNSVTKILVDLDSAVGAGATVQGVVTSTNPAVRLVNASVQLSGDGIDARSAVTDSTGAFKFEGLPEGAVNVKVTMDGYAPASVDETLVGANVYTKNFALTAAGGSITGTVYSQKLPFAKVQAGAQIVAYDDTYNGLHPTEPLALLKTMTGSDGSYKISGLVPGDVYKVFLKVTGKYTLSVATTAVDGTLAGVDFIMLAKPLDIELFARKGDQFYEFTVLNPKDFKGGSAYWCAAPFVSTASATELSLTTLSSGELSGKIPLSSLAPNTVYVLHGEADSYSGKHVVRELLFGKGYKGNTRQNIDDIILGDDTEDDKGRKNNEAAMDRSGDDPSALAFPPGAVLPVSTGAIPTCTFKGQGKDDAAVADKVAALGADAFAGNLYTVSMDSVTSNDNKSIELTLAYDKTTASLTDLTVARYNDGTGSWDQVPGVATVNPLKGTVKVKLKNLASVLARPGSVQVNSFDGRQYSVRPRASAASSSTSGTFAVIRPSVVTGGGYSGSKLKVFNYPNPFNLKDKAISNNQGASLPGTTNGTVIHVEVPAGNGGAGHVRIYTLAGELVKDISANFTAGTHNYVLWDGHNSGGQEVANGVYYGVVELSGKKPSLKDATFKMAVVK